ncbi:MAG TPA: glycerophosphodiester phosphodiesterase family protein, partial [Anaerolineales bacterium]
GIWQAPGSAWPPAAGVGLHWLAPVLDPTLGPRLRARGEELWVWTLNDVRLMRWMAWLGVDGITSDDPRLKP